MISRPKRRAAATRALVAVRSVHADYHSISGSCDDDVSDSSSVRKLSQPAVRKFSIQVSMVVIHTQLR